MRHRDSHAVGADKDRADRAEQRRPAAGETILPGPIRVAVDRIAPNLSQRGACRRLKPERPPADDDWERLGATR